MTPRFEYFGKPLVSAKWRTAAIILFIGGTVQWIAGLLGVCK